MSIVIVEGLDEIIARMEAFPSQLDAAVQPSMQASLLTLHENVPAYPVVPNPTRTGLLGRSLGSSEGGACWISPMISPLRFLGS